MFAAFSSSFITTPGITSRIQLTLSLYGRTWIRWNSSRRCSPRIDAYRMFVSTPRMMSSYSARRRAMAVSPTGSTKPAHSNAEFSQSRYSGESSNTRSRYSVGEPRISRSGNSSSEPPVPRDATVIRSMCPLIAPMASWSAGNSAICPFSRRSRKLILRLSEHPVHHPLHVEPFDVLIRLAEVHEDDRLPDCLGHRERRAPLRVRVDFREDDPVQPDRLVELLRLFDGIVPREGVPDVQDQVRLRNPLDLLHLVHQVLVRLHPPRGVDQHDVATPGPGVLHRVEGDRGGVRARVVFDQLEPDCFCMLLELLDGSGAERVGRGDDARVPLLLDVVRELRNRRRLARAVHTDEHHDERPRALLEEPEEVQRGHGERLRDRVPEGPLDAFLEAHIPGDPFPLQIVREAVDDLLCDREGDVRFEERDLQVVQDFLELVLLDLTARFADRLGAHLRLGFLLPPAEPFPERLEHLAPLARRGASLKAVVQVLHGLALGFRAPLQLSEPLADRVRRVRDRLDPRIQPLELLGRAVIHEEVGPDRDERLVHLPRLRDEEGIRPDRHQDLGRLARLLIADERLTSPQVLLERDANDFLLLGQRFDVRPVLVEDGDPPAEFRFARAHLRASSA